MRLDRGRFDGHRQRADEPVRVAIAKALDGELEAAEIEHVIAAESAARVA